MYLMIRVSQVSYLFSGSRKLAHDSEAGYAIILSVECMQSFFRPLMSLRIGGICRGYELFVGVLQQHGVDGDKNRRKRHEQGTELRP